MEVLCKGPAASGVTAEMLTMVMASDLKKIHDGGGDELESIVVHEVPLKNVEVWLKKMEKKGKLVGMRIYTGLYFLNKYNKRKQT